MPRPRHMRQLISYMMEDSAHDHGRARDRVIASRSSAVGDHAKNIAEAVVQVVKGIDVRHATAEQIRAEVASE